MNDPTVIAAAIVTVIAAVVAGTVTVVNAISSARDRANANVARAHLQHSADDTGRKADTLLEKTVEIHSVTNSNLAKITAALELSQQENTSLKALMATMLSSSQDAARLAASSAAAAVLATNTRSSQPPELAKIETNTRDTADALKKETP